MFVSLKVHIRALDEAAAKRAECETLERQHTEDRVTIAWLCARVNQLEQERATLFHAVTNLNIPVPAVTTAPAAPVPSTEMLRPFGVGMFEDMGEEEARRQGIEYDSEGRVKYTR